MLVRVCERCGSFVKQGEKCPNCAPPERRNKSEHEFYYSTEWKRIATAARQRANYTDEYLLRYDGRAYEANLVHHIYPIKERPALQLDLGNLVVVSNRTHEMIHRAYAKGGDEKEKMQEKLLAIRGQT